MVIGNVIRRTARSYPNKTGVVFRGRETTWREVDERSDRVGRSLQALGLPYQSRVGVMMSNCSEFVDIIFGIAKAGLVAVPINPRLSGEALAYVVNHSEPGALIVDEGSGPAVKALAGGLSVRELFGCGGTFDREIPDLFDERFSGEPDGTPCEEDLFCLAYTSGTTGKPKAAMISHRNMMSAATISVLEMRLLPHYNYLCALPQYTMGALSTIFTSIRGCTIIIEDFEPGAILKAFQDRKIAAAQLGKAQIEALLQSPDIDRFDYGSLQVICCVGSVLPSSQVKRAVEKFGNVMMYTYGLTETMGAGGTVLQKEDIVLHDESNSALLSIGKPKMNVDVRIIDENGDEVAPGEDRAGELVIRGDMVMKGYWKQPDKTALCIKEGWFYTGDLATMDADGFIYPVGRKTDVVVKGEDVISPHEIEEIILTHPAVLEVAVAGVETGQNEVLVAFIVPRAGHRVDAEGVVEFCRQRLRPALVPTSVRFLSKFPKTEIGKVIREKLKELYASGERVE